MTSRPITYRTKPGVRVQYHGISTIHNSRKGTVGKFRRDGMLQIVFDEGHNRAAEYYFAWPEALTRLATTDPKPTFYRCGICECLHPIKWNGDCREDAARFAADQLDEKYGSLGWQEVEMPVAF